MQEIDLADILTIRAADTLSVECEGVPQEKNLAYRAAKAFFAETSIPGGAEITIEKHIPSEAGMGGGSSDAACVLHALNEIYDAKLSLSELSKIVGWGSVLALGLAPEILAFLAPKSYGDSLYAIAPFALSSLPYFLYGIATVILCYREKTKYVSASAILGAAINIFANFLIIPRLGYAGGAIAYLISQALTFILASSWLRRYDAAAADALSAFPTMLLTFGFGALLVLLYPNTLPRILLLIIPAVLCLKSGFSALRMAKEKQS